MAETMTASAADERTAVAEVSGVSALGLAGYLAAGTFFGILLIKSEVASWFRIQEMFRFGAFHMYGVLGSAVVVGALSLRLLARLGPTTRRGEEIRLAPKDMHRGAVRYWAGGLVFGLGWALLGACPGPIYALLGEGVTVMVVALASAVAGTWTYGALRSRLPH